MEQPTGPNPHKEAAKNQVEADIEQMKRAVENATVEEVDTPSGRKDVEIAWMEESEDSVQFRHKEGPARGVYFEPGRMNPVRVHIDWTEDAPEHWPDRTTAEWENVETFEESDYYVEGES